MENNVKNIDDILKCFQHGTLTAYAANNQTLFEGYSEEIVEMYKKSYEGDFDAACDLVDTVFANIPVVEKISNGYVATLISKQGQNPIVSAYNGVNRARAVVTALLLLLQNIEHQKNVVDNDTE